MRILIYGAGNIGRLYAGRLTEGGQDVTILARPGSFDGTLRLENLESGARSQVELPVIERLETNDAYDLALICLPKSAVASALPALAANEATPAVMFFCNNAAGHDEMIEALGAERVLAGFPGAAAVTKDGVTRYLIMSGRVQPTTIGELDGRRTERIEAIAEAFSSGGFPVSICGDIDAWLKTHVAEILPTVCALARDDYDAERLAEDPETLSLMVSSIREGHRVLRGIGVNISPAKHRVFDWLPVALLKWLMKKALTSKSATIKLGHAAGGEAEWRWLEGEFRALIRRSGTPTPSTDQLVLSVGAT